MQSTSHKYHSYQPICHERQTLHKYYENYNELAYQTATPYNEFNSTIIQNEQYKTSNKTSYKGAQPKDIQGQYRKAPFHGYMNYVNDSEINKIKFPEFAFGESGSKTMPTISVTQRTYQNPKNLKNFPNFQEIISAEKPTVGISAPFAATSVTKSDFNNKNSRIDPKNSKILNLSKPITRHNLPPIKSLTTIKPNHHKNYNLTANPIKPIENQYQTSTDRSHRWPIQKISEVEEGRGLKISNFYGSSQWGTGCGMNRSNTSYSVLGQDRMSGFGKKFADLYN